MALQLLELTLPFGQFLRVRCCRRYEYFKFAVSFGVLSIVADRPIPDLGYNVVNLRFDPLYFIEPLLLVVYLTLKGRILTVLSFLEWAALLGKSVEGQNHRYKCGGKRQQALHGYLRWISNHAIGGIVESVRLLDRLVTYENIDIMIRKKKPSEASISLGDFSI